MSEDEQYGYEGTYFPEVESPESNFPHDGYISASPEAYLPAKKRHRPRETTLERHRTEEEHIAEAIFFSYGVAVFFGFSEMQERDILDDLDNAGIWIRKRPEEEWEVEECHYVVSFLRGSLLSTMSNSFKHDPFVEFPRIYNDFLST